MPLLFSPIHMVIKVLGKLPTLLSSHQKLHRLVKDLNVRLQITKHDYKIRLCIVKWFRTKTKRSCCHLIKFNLVVFVKMLERWFSQSILLLKKSKLGFYPNLSTFLFVCERSPTYQ